MAKSITEVLGIKYPIIQGGMAWISDAKLAAAVSNAGGAGIISCGGRTTEYVREEIRKAKQLTDKPFGVNVMLMAPNKDEIVDVICEEKPAFVTLGAGNPVPYFAKLKEAGIKVIPVIPNVKLAKRVATAGADAMVAECIDYNGSYDTSNSRDKRYSSCYGWWLRRWSWFSSSYAHGCWRCTDGYSFLSSRRMFCS